jgi:hypothetical protein
MVPKIEPSHPKTKLLAEFMIGFEGYCLIEASFVAIFKTQQYSPYV